MTLSLSTVTDILDFPVEVADTINNNNALIENAFNSSIISSSSISDIKTINPITSKICILSDPLRPGIFIWNEGDYSGKIDNDPQNGVYVKANSIASVSGAWVRAFSGDLNVKWFNATGNGITADNVAIQSAVNLCGFLGGGFVYFPTGTYKIGSTIVITDPYVKLRGSGPISTIISPSTTGMDAIKFWIGDTIEIKNAGLRDLSIIPSVHINRNIWVKNHYQFMAENISIWGSNNIGFEFENGTVAYNGILRDVFVNSSSIAGLLLGANGVGDLQNILLYNCHFDGSNLGTGVLVRNCGGLVWNGGESLNKDTSMRIAPNLSGYRVNGVRITSVFFDTPVNDCLNITVALGTKVSDSIFVNCHFNSSQNGSGVVLGGLSSDTTLINTIKFVACNFTINKKYGLYATYTQKITIIGGDFISNGVDGISSNISLDIGSSYVTITGGNSGSGGSFDNLSRWGVVISSGVTNVVITNIILIGNVLGPISDNGIGTKVINCPGCVSFNKGSGLIPLGSSSITINHGLSFTPSKEDINIKWVSDTQGSRIWVSSVTSTTFTLTSSSAMIAGWFFGWEVGVKGN